MQQLFWLNDQEWSVLEERMPRYPRGNKRVDDRRVLSGIVHVLQSGCRWRDCPSAYGPYTTVYNRFNRWSKKGHWQRLFALLVKQRGDPDLVSLDSTHVKAHRCAAGGKGGRKTKRWGHRGVAVTPRYTR